MPIIVESSRANSDLFLSVTGADTQVVASLEELQRLLADSPNEYAIVLGPAVDLEAAAALADMLRVTRPTISVILMRRRVDTSCSRRRCAPACARSSTSATSPASARPSTAPTRSGPR